MPVDFTKLTSLSYLISRFPGPLSDQFFWAWFGVSLGLMVLALAFRIWLKWQKEMAPARLRLFRRFATALFTLGFLSLLFFFFRVENLPFLSMRFFMALWAVGALVWFGYLSYVAWRRLPDDVHAWQEQRRIAKYLTRPK